MSTDLQRLESMLERLRRLELHVPLPHERSIVEVARRELGAQIRVLSHRLHDRAYLRTPRCERTAVVRA